MGNKSKVNYILFISVLSFGVLSYYIFYPLNNRVNETVNDIKILYFGVSFEQKVEQNAIYMSSISNTLSKDYFIEEIMKNESPRWKMYGIGYELEK